VNDADIDDSRTAILSLCGTYRYLLTRTWDANRSPACWVMLNPSTADATQDDPTIRRCVGFARDWGCGGIVVVNLFAFRATDPAALRTAPDPIGPDNDNHIRRAVTIGGATVVCAWGAHGTLLGRGRSVADLIRSLGVVPQCLGTTRDGQPRHPLYVPSARALEAYLCS
jgi:hypothetical protein